MGYTLSIPDEDKVLNSLSEMKDELAVFMGGRVAEELFCDDITTGASNDIEQATKLARAMITRYGMSDDFGMVALETVTNQYLGGDTSLACSADTQTKILTDNRGKLDELAKHLYEKETITGEEFMHILNA